MTITIVSIAIIFLVFFYCCYRIKKAVKNNTFRQEKNIIEYMPSVLTTFGVLGTDGMYSIIFFSCLNVL